ncbi:MAG: HD domain-containing protein [Thiovulaceae bacterium]|nr:HD domain-containing protein [Sulfurimonadaceae bacterium]
MLWANRALLEFTGFASNEAFFAEYQCICELFKCASSYLSSCADERLWVERILTDTEKDHKIMIQKGADTRIFLPKVQVYTHEETKQYVVVLQDVTLSDRAHNRLLQEYKEVVDRSAIVSKTDARGIITFVNKKFCDISGYREDELVDRRHNIIRHPAMPSAVFSEMWGTISDKKPWYGIVQNRRKEGGAYYVDTVINPIVDCNGDIVEYIGIRYDITKIETVKSNLYAEIEETQKTLLYRLGEIGEIRSHDTAKHVKRVAEYSRLLALKAGLDESEASILQLSSPMHDIGKITIPDHILNKKGYLTAAERTVMQTHCENGYNILKNYDRPILAAAAIVAYQHHERWDGTGYPRGLKGEEIHILGRITAVADVYDALSTTRPYKEAWSDSKILAYFKENYATHFDPELVDLFFAHFDEFIAIGERHRCSQDLRSTRFPR